MKIAFLEGTELVEQGVEKRLEQSLRAAVRNESSITFLFRPDGRWTRLEQL